MTKRKSNNPPAGETDPFKSMLDPELIAKELARMTSSQNGRRAPRQLFFDEQWVATRLGVELKTVENWRYKAVGPASHKFGKNGAVRYRLRDIVAFEKKSRNSTED